ncbi:MAG: hypothetical protein AB7O26_09560 [Planctomycetaceae bacterium]
MSPRSSKKGRADGPAPVADVYVGLLVVSVAALLTGITFLCLELNKYGWALPGG